MHVVLCVRVPLLCFVCYCTVSCFRFFTFCLSIIFFVFCFFFFFSSRRRHTRCLSDWSSDVCSSDLVILSSCHLVIFVGGHASTSSAASRIAACACSASPRSRTASAGLSLSRRSEERRVGKEWRSGWWAEALKRKADRSILSEGQRKM